MGTQLTCVHCGHVVHVLDRGGAPDQRPRCGKPRPYPVGVRRRATTE